MTDTIKKTKVRVELIKAIKTPLQVFALVMTILEVLLVILAQKASGVNLTILIIGIVANLFAIIALFGITLFKSPHLLLGIKPVKLSLSTEREIFEPKENFERNLLKIRVNKKIRDDDIENIKTALHVITNYKEVNFDKPHISFAVSDQKDLYNKLFEVLDKNIIAELEDWQLIDYVANSYRDLDPNLVSKLRRHNMINSRNNLTFSGVNTIRHLASKIL